MFSQPSASKTYNSGGYKKGYHMEGTGRDTYIANNNGGFTIAHQIPHHSQPGTIYYPQNDVLFYGK